MVHVLVSYVDGALVGTASMVLMKMLRTLAKFGKSDLTIWWIVLLYFTVKKKLLLKIYKRFDDVVVSTAPGNYITMLKD